VSEVSETTVKEVAAVPPKTTWVTPERKPVPLTVTVLPPAVLPVAGLTAVTVGAVAT
jgi:hypothetical protein